MAKTKKTDETSGARPQAPAGARRLTSDRSAPWFRPSKWAVIHGNLLGRFTMTDGEGDTRAFYQIRVTGEPVDAVRGSGKDKEEVVVERGSVVNLNESKAVEVLRPYAESDGKFRVWICVEEKKKVKRGTFWPMDVQIETVVAPKTRLVSAPAATEEPEDHAAHEPPIPAGDDDIPF